MGVNKIVISVIMAVYNCEEYLSEAIESILEQTCRDFEFIIIDDGSIDGSAEIIKDACNRDPRIRASYQENVGLTKSLNRAVDLAEGQFIARMDADDISLPNRLERQLEFMYDNPTIGCVGTWAYRIYGKNKNHRVNEWRVPEESEMINEFHRKGLGAAMIHPTILMRRELLTDVGGYDESIICAQDYELWCRLGKMTQLANIPEVHLLYRLRAESVTVDKRALQIETSVRIASKHFGVIDPLEEGSHIGFCAESRISFLERWAEEAWSSRNRSTSIRILYEAVLMDSMSFRTVNCFARKRLLRIWKRIKGRVGACFSEIR